MIQEGSIVLFRFPQTDQLPGKLRPALVLRQLPGPHNDWLICMVSTQLSQQIEGLDECIKPEDRDFKQSGLKAPSLFRVSRLAVVDKSILFGSIGQISTDRLSRIKTSLSDWIKNP
ncbi:MAG TPA: type II toxin-antitoxin system PemK/MazF family toxin [Phycisphaerales bacterium]|nr:type II toxin-antitoxin system PemK/MazF family toxin [Phycisphaerales bacterium]